MSQALTCREFVEFLADYLSGTLSQERQAIFNQHLAVCPSCIAYMKTYQASVRLGRAVFTRSEETLPEEVPEELVLAILAARKRP
jgi:anti-sigma factor RsiW